MDWENAPNTFEFLQEETAAEGTREVCRTLRDELGIEADPATFYLSQWLLAQSVIYPREVLAAIGGPIELLKEDAEPVMRMIARIENKPFYPDKGVTGLQRERNLFREKYYANREYVAILRLVITILVVAWGVDHFWL